MKFTPYPFQGAAIDHGAQFLAIAEPNQRQLYAAPTGCGKSVVELLVQEQFPNCWIVSPRDEIIAGMLDKLGDPDGDMLAHKICTPIRLRNMLMRGDILHPSHLILDESHHESAETYQQLDLLAGMCPTVGYTATPYRGSPRSTRDFRERWGDPLWLISYEEAVRMKYISMPTFEMLPLVDDDVVEISGGEFSVTSLDSVTVDRLGDLADHARRWYNGQNWDRYTVFAVPSTACCVRLHQELLRRGLPCTTVSAATPKAERNDIFAAAKARILALIHINILQEGFDAPIRRIVDLAPTLSPVKWVQQLGRATRPAPDGEPPPEYIGTNRNLLRHAYVLEGAVPASAAVDAERAFPSTERAHSRVLGLEAIGRFKPTSVKLSSGTTIHMYSLSTVQNGVVLEFCVLIHPCVDPIWATKVNQVVDGEKKWGSWRACEAPDDVRGFNSIAPRELSEKQMAWWKRSAARYGIDPDQEVTRKNFQILPVCSDLDLRRLR